MSGVLDESRRELYGFGPFRVDADKEVLLRDGKPVPLTPKAFQILLVLVRRGGEVATKDEIMTAVWPDTFVEETNLTRNIFSIRRALGEGSENQYILTVSGKGYRLAEKAVPVLPTELNIVSAVRSTVEVEIHEERKKGRLGWIAAAAAIVVAGAVGGYEFLQRSSGMTETDTLVIADFSNGTNDPVFDQTLTQGLAVQLEQSPFLQIVSDQRVQHMLQLMGRASGEHLTAALAREVCERIGATVMLEGSISTLGNEYVLGLRATRCVTGDLLDVEQATAKTKEQVLDAMTEIARRFRRRAGESRQTRQMHDKPLEEGTTASLEALKAYSAGLRMSMNESLVVGIPLLKRAVELDPNFAFAWAHLALGYANTGQTGPGAEAAKRAYELRNRASDRERFLIEVTYDRIVTGNLERARQTCMSWAQSYPRDPVAHALASGLILQGLGDFDISIEEARKALALDPDLSPAYTNLAFSYFLEGQMQQATNVMAEASARGFNPPEMLALRYAIAFANADAEEMKRAAASAVGKPWAEDWMTQFEALAAAA
jgi:DNA-binding winged helix-turn-helix (wHTH) protein/tetratricopeptide (TPR) repeat protein